MLKYLMAYNNHEYGSKSIYRQHMECLPHGLNNTGSKSHGLQQQSWVRQQEYLSSTHGMLKYLMA